MFGLMVLIEIVPEQIQKVLAVDVSQQFQLSENLGLAETGLTILVSGWYRSGLPSNLSSIQPVLAFNEASFNVHARFMVTITRNAINFVSTNMTTVPQAGI